MVCRSHVPGPLCSWFCGWHRGSPPPGDPSAEGGSLAHCEDSLCSYPSLKEQVSSPGSETASETAPVPHCKPSDHLHRRGAQKIFPCKCVSGITNTFFRWNVASRGPSSQSVPSSHSRDDFARLDPRSRPRNQLSDFAGTEDPQGAVKMQIPGTT